MKEIQISASEPYQRLTDSLLPRRSAGCSEVTAAVLAEHAVAFAKDQEVESVVRWRRDWSTVKKPSPGYTSQGRKPGAICRFLTTRAWGRMIHTIKNCDVDFHSMLTCTYPNEFPADGRIVKGHLDAFKKRLKRRFPEIRGIWFLEFQRRGAPHFHFLVCIDLSLYGDLVRVRRTGKYRGQKSQCFFTVPDLMQDVSAMWDGVVKSGDPAHKRAGCCWEVLESAEAAQKYAAMHSAKAKQKEVPKAFRNVGRFWGKIGVVNLVQIGIFPATTADVLYAFGPSAFSAKGRLKRYLFDAETREVQ